MSNPVIDQKVIIEGLNTLAKKDKDLALGLEQVGYPIPRIRPAGFETLLSIVVGQQISTEAAAAILGRLLKLLSEPTAENYVLLNDTQLREAGLSVRKVEYTMGLAEAIISGELDLTELEILSDKESLERITSLRGFGAWSAEIYLMFCLHRRDIFPAGDLALRIGLQKLKKIENKLDEKQSREIMQQWSPHRSVGSLFLWHYYRGAPS